MELTVKFVCTCWEAHAVCLKLCACVHTCVRAGLCACVRACVRACVCVCVTAQCCSRWDVSEHRRENPTVRPQRVLPKSTPRQAWVYIAGDRYNIHSLWNRGQLSPNGCPDYPLAKRKHPLDPYWKRYDLPENVYFCSISCSKVANQNLDMVMQQISTILLFYVLVWCIVVTLLSWSRLSGSIEFSICIWCVLILCFAYFAVCLFVCTGIYVCLSVCRVSVVVFSSYFHCALTCSQMTQRRPLQLWSPWITSNTVLVTEAARKLQSS